MPKAPRKTKSQKGTRFLQPPRGMRDVLSEEQLWWDRIGRVVKDLADFYNFGRIETPVVEFAELYEKGTGSGTDIVQKEMYTLRTKGGDRLALRPEYTPGIMRAYLARGLGRLGQPQRLYHLGPVFRHESPQAGRLRQFAQIGFEVIGGASDPVYDAQVILIFERLLEELKIKNIVLKLNSIGCKICRPIYKRQLQNYYRYHEGKLCADCLRRLKENPLRLLDCKEDPCEALKAKAPNILDKLCVTCSSHLKAVLEYLDELKISYGIDNHLVRGLDYYSRTVFEFFVDGAGSEVGALPAGGRYDYLAELLGGRLTPAVGGACGVERLIAVMKAQEVKSPQKAQKKVFVVHVGELAKKKALSLIEELRKAGISASEAIGRESLKAQLKAADKEGVKLAAILGQKEIFEESIIVRDLGSGLQETVPLSRMVEEIRKRLSQ